MPLRDPVRTMASQFYCGMAREIAIPTGESRLAKTWPDGSYSCPWCGGAVLPGMHAFGKDVFDIGGCGNPACYVNSTIELIEADRERRRLRQEERDRSARNHELAMQRIAESRERERVRLNELLDEADERGACVPCLRRSNWPYRPKFIRHRDPANCPNGGRR